MTNEQIASIACKYNSGKAMCDSGDAYGRHWERLKDIDLSTTEPFIIDINKYEGHDNLTIQVGLSTYHYLSIAIDQDLLCEEFNELPEEARRWFLEHIADELDGSSMNNTYNSPSALSQCILYRTFIMSNQEYILFQVHTGCDVRGGYSAPFMSVEFNVCPDIELSHPEAENDWRYSSEGYFEDVEEDMPEIRVSVGTDNDELVKRFHISDYYKPKVENDNPLEYLNRD